MKYKKYVLYCSRHNDETATQVMVMIYALAYQARKFLDVLLEDDGIVWEDGLVPLADPGSTIRSETGIVVSTRFDADAMRRAVEHEYEVKEMAWDLPPADTRYARHFRHGPPAPRTLEEAGVKAERVKRTASAPRASAPVGYVHVSDIALSMGIDAKQARVALRKIYKGDKPIHGWSFPPSEVEALKARIREVVK